MTTLTVSLARLGDCVRHGPKALRLDPELLAKAKAIVYCARVQEGRVKDGKNAGLFISRTEATGEWGRPVALHFLEGTLDTAGATYGPDLLVLILDAQVARTFVALGQCGWGPASGHVVQPGPLSGGRRSPKPNAGGPAVTTEAVSYAYYVGFRNVTTAGVAGGTTYKPFLLPAGIKDAVLQCRSSSTEKFYNTRNANVSTVIGPHAHELVVPAASQKAIDKATAHLDKLFAQCAKPGQLVADQDSIPIDSDAPPSPTGGSKAAGEPAGDGATKPGVQTVSLSTDSAFRWGGTDAATDTSSLSSPDAKPPQPAADDAALSAPPPPPPPPPPPCMRQTSFDFET